MSKNIDFFAVDLHVHTPFSSCYKVKVEDTTKELMNILRRYIVDGVKIISFTDHNSIKGYKTLCEYKDRLLADLIILQELSLKYDLGEKIIQITEELNIFNEILVLPGIELEVNPGIHILIIFNPEIPLDRIDFLISSAGYSSDTMGQELSSYASIELLQLFDRLKDYDAIVIGAHVDSSKGIYNALEGNYRIQILRHERLNGLQYNSQKSADQINSLMIQKEYKRNSPLAFIKASDFHGDYSQPTEKTYIKLDSINYVSLKNSFSNPAESISLTPHPEIKDIILNIISSKNSYCFDSLNNTTPEILLKVVCSMLNIGHGYLIFGVSNDKHHNFIGLDAEHDEVLDYLSKHLENLKPKKQPFKMEVSSNEWAGKNIILIKLSNVNDVIYSLDNGELYIFENQKPVSAKAAQIISLAEEKITKNYTDYLIKYRQRIKNLNEKLSLLIELSTCTGKLVDIDKISLRLSTIVNVSFINKTENDNVIFYGESNGNFFRPSNSPSRLQNSYLRFIPECSTVKDLSKYTIYTEPSIIIVPEGGAYYIDINKPHAIVNDESDKPYLRLTIVKNYSSIFSYEFIIALLKSTFVNMYNYSTIDSIRIYSPAVLKNIPIIQENIESVQQIIKPKIEYILQLERDFLNVVRDMEQSEISNYLTKTTDLNYDEDDPESAEDMNRVETFISGHNELISSILFEIDEHIFEHAKCDDYMIELSSKILDLHNIYDYANAYMDSLDS